MEGRKMVCNREEFQCQECDLSVANTVKQN